MKKFKHKQTNEIAIETETDYCLASVYHLPKSIVEKSCDWEEVIEKDYEVLEYYHRNSDTYYKRDLQLKDTWCVKDGIAPFFKEDQVSKCSIIYKVKRLSDGEIFKLGDLVIPTNLKDRDNQGYKPISKIEVVDDKCIISIVPSYMSRDINDIKKEKIEIITADGIHLRERNTCYLVSNEVHLITITKDNYRPLPKSLLFASLDRAEMHLRYLRDKKCLSINDVINTLGKILPYFESELIQFVNNQK
jgi:hypothetical protein